MERDPHAPAHAHEENAFGPGAGTLRIAALRQFLQGTWRLARAIEDRRGGLTGMFRGQACFAPVGADAGAGLVLTEAGRLRLGGHGGPAYRRTLYRFPAPGRAAVAFADGRPFHDLDLSEGAWAAEHRCGADLYRGAFRALDPDTLMVRWAVTGPRKDAVLTSRYRRRPVPAG